MTVSEINKVTVRMRFGSMILVPEQMKSIFLMLCLKSRWIFVSLFLKNVRECEGPKKHNLNTNVILQ